MRSSNDANVSLVAARTTATPPRERDVAKRVFDDGEDADDDVTLTPCASLCRETEWCLRVTAGTVADDAATQHALAIIVWV